MIRDGEKLYIGTNEVPDEKPKAICYCEHLRIELDYGVPYNHEDCIKTKCNILSKKFLFFFKKKNKCTHFENKDFGSCKLYTPDINRDRGI